MSLLLSGTLINLSMKQILLFLFATISLLINLFKYFLIFKHYLTDKSLGYSFFEFLS